MWINFSDREISKISKIAKRKDLIYDVPNDIAELLKEINEKLVDAQEDHDNPALKRYVTGAIQVKMREGECEIDPDAVVSKGGDAGTSSGAYVMAWVWVNDGDLEPGGEGTDDQ